MHQAVKESSRARRYLLEGTWGKVVVEWGEKCWQEGSGFSVPASERQTESQLAKRPRFTVARFKLHHNQSSIFKPLMSSHFFSFFLSEPVDSNIVCLYIIPIFLFTVTAAVSAALPLGRSIGAALSETTLVITPVRFMPLPWTLCVDSYFWQGN